ncbi:2-amino-4-hydroxy-6-hydroxymethyldihydropteridine diphosphokinase [Rhodobacterales bacterium LSUCC0031]|nr:2-amino-4-hydroxy-6-hydroxymethyldihydropteridine diphosphokinase [Rhodobacterales bacterium LSUCC0031]
MDQSTEKRAAKRALLAFGGNLAHSGRLPQEILKAAVDLLAVRLGRPVALSKLYRTPAFPTGSGPDFINAAGVVDWHGSAASLLALLHEVEAALGRTRRTRWEARILDIDLIALADEVWPDPVTQKNWASLSIDQAAHRSPAALILPHPRMAERSFVLVPLSEVAGDWRHPLTGLSVAEMLALRPAAERATVVALDLAG